MCKLLRGPGIDSQPGGPLQQPYLTYRPAWLHRLAESIPQNRFLDSLNVYKCGLFSDPVAEEQEKEPSRNRVVVPARKATYAGGIGAWAS
jgi:hypothetical protein